MNCRQIEDLLPLYVSHDLGEKRARMVMDHLRDCTVCAGADRELRGVQQLLQDFTPPAFSDSDYAAIRQSVWRRIETERAAPTLVESIAGWFTPRLAWAAVLSMALLAGGIYFFTRTNPDHQEVVVRTPSLERRKSDKGPDGASRNPLVSGERQRYIPRRQSIAQRSPRKEPRLQSAPLVAVAPQLAGPGPSRASGKSLRMEIQTRDPNIRIIWLAQ